MRIRAWQALRPHMCMRIRRLPLSGVCLRFRRRRSVGCLSLRRRNGYMHGPKLQLASARPSSRRYTYVQDGRVCSPASTPRPGHVRGTARISNRLGSANLVSLSAPLWSLPWRRQRTTATGRSTLSRQQSGQSRCMVACVHTVVIRSPPNAVPSGHRCRAAVGVVGALGGFSFFFRGVSPPLHGSDFRWMRFPLDAISAGCPWIRTHIVEAQYCSGRAW